MVSACSDGAGTGDDDGDDGAFVDADDSGPSPLGALVGIYENAGGSASALATFSFGPLFGGPVSSAAGCDYYVAPHFEGESAGTISITGTTPPVTLVPSAERPHRYDVTQYPPANVYAPGAAVTFSAAGGMVPAFSGTVTAPAPLAGVGFPEVQFARSNPPPIVWDAGAGDEIWIWVMVMTMPSHYEVLWCRASDVGHFTIPREGMALFSPDLPNGSVTLWRVASETVRAGDWGVELLVADRATSNGLAFVP